jgi:hypothetical protein
MEWAGLLVCRVEALMTHAGRDDDLPVVQRAVALQPLPDRGVPSTDWRYPHLG